MSSKILITGAAGYIGGSLVADFLSDNSPAISKDQIIAAVRSQEQADALAKLDIPVLQLDLADKDAVLEAILSHNVNIVIHTTSAIDPATALSLIDALGKQREDSGKKTYFIHTSGLSAFYEGTGWPAGRYKDTDAVFETEKRLAQSFPIRNTDVSVIEHAEKRGVTSFVVVPSCVYGKGTGEWNKVSVVLPVYFQASLTHKAVWKFPENTKVSAVHISDLTALYSRIIETLLQDEPLPSDKEGYYFALAHDIFFGDVLDHLAIALKARGLVTDSEARIYPNNKVASELLGVPEQFVTALWNSGDNIVAEVPFKIGWKPQWTKERFFDNINDEIDAALELGKAKSTLIDSLWRAA
ncbi:hypothetical protein BJX76DRAFT_143798 [Aspergillus varians]